MNNLKGKTVAALCSGAAGLALALCGIGVAAAAPNSTTAPESSVVPAPPSPADTTGGGALPVKPAGGGPSCIAGLNCGPINPDRPPPPKRPPRLVHGPGDPAPLPQHP
ncbi:hypothetical protein OK015_14795 [Mycobacterium sp. Aquia_216]|uniref:hypothetical protein n=1 Tax=Mycobacterium sp. Aquia_216 TaxID=2991729 RepID=UPI00227AC9BE|nr:hypothetical protein [Mycobacterium sp. Aquia_216]WAJ42554.1 hypothetical protein OK015_14795 [Mycobacterium sp. Aquia_216]